MASFDEALVRGPDGAWLSEAALTALPACADVADCLAVDLKKVVKSIAVVSEHEEGKKTFALLLLRGDHELNEIKASKIAGLSPFRLASEGEVEEFLGCKPGYIGKRRIVLGERRIFDVPTYGQRVCLQQIGRAHV